MIADIENPFLTIITRTIPERNEKLDRNIASANRQTSLNFLHWFLHDPDRLGVGESYRRIAELAPLLVSRYVFILDDDDELIDNDFVRKILPIAYEYNPAVIMVKMDHGAPLGVLPDAEHWRYPVPVLGKFGVSSFVVRTDVFKKCAHGFTPTYDGDFNFLFTVFQATGDIYWLDCIASKTQNGASRGK